MVHIFILNNNAGKRDRANGIREYLASRKDLKYFIFNTMESGSEQRIMRMVRKYFPDEKIRVYACGGSGTMRNVFDGAGDDFSKTEFAFFPCGLSNDFLKAFPGGQKQFEVIENLIDGKVVYLDYIKTDGGICMNSVSGGVDVAMSRYTDEAKPYAMIYRQLPYLLGTMQAAFRAKDRRLRLTIDGDVMEDDFCEVFFANGPYLGGNIRVSEDNNIADGVGSAVMVSKRKGLMLFPLLFLLMQGKFAEFRKKKNCYMRRFTKIELQDLSGGKISMNLDGEIVEERESWTIEVVRRGLPFVVPKGMKYVIEDGETHE